MTRAAKLLEDVSVLKAINSAVLKAKIRPRDFKDVVQDTKHALLIDEEFLTAKVPAAFARTVARNKAVDHIRQQREILNCDLKLVRNGDKDDPGMLHIVDLQHDGHYYANFLRQDNRIQRSLPMLDFEWIRAYAHRKRKRGNKFTAADRKKFQRLKEAYSLERFVSKAPQIEHSKGIVAGASIGPETIYDPPIPIPAEWPVGEASRRVDYGITNDYGKWFLSPWSEDRPTMTGAKVERKYIRRGAGTSHAVIELRAAVKEKELYADSGSQYALNQPAENIIIVRSRRSRRNDHKR
jgi:Sigma-70 region 2